MNFYTSNKEIRTFPLEGHICEFPMWSYSKKRTSIKKLHITYPDKSYVTINALKGFPGTNFPGYLDVILMNCQRDIFHSDYAEISVYDILKKLGINPSDGNCYRNFKRDMERAFSMQIITDRFIDPETGERTFTTYFRILNTMKISNNKKNISKFYFNDIFLESLKSGYLKRLDFDFCLFLDREGKALTRFLYAHLLKRIGKNPYYIRNFNGFLSDVGLEYISNLPNKNKNQKIKKTLFPALDLLKSSGKVFSKYEFDNNENIIFYSLSATKSIWEYRQYPNIKRKNRKTHLQMVKECPKAYIKHVDMKKRQGLGPKEGNYFEDIYLRALKLYNKNE